MKRLDVFNGRNFANDVKLMLPSEHAPNDGYVFDDYSEWNRAQGAQRAEDQSPRPMAIAVAKLFDHPENVHVQIDGAG